MPDAQILPFDGGASSARAQKARTSRTRPPGTVPPAEGEATTDPGNDLAQTTTAGSVADGADDAESTLTGVSPEVVKPDGAKPPRAKAPRVEPAGVKPAGVKAPGVKPAGVKPAGVKPAGVKPAGVKPAGVKAPGVKRAGVKAPGVKSSGVKPAGVKVAGATADGVKLDGVKLDGVKPVGGNARPNGVKSVVEAPPAEATQAPLAPPVGSDAPPSAFDPAPVAGPRSDVGSRTSEQVGAEDPWDRRVAGTLAFLRRRLTGEYETDEFGFDPDFATSVLAPALRPIYRKWFRVEMSGLEHLDGDHGALLVANHSGTIPVDASMLQLGILDQHPAHRHLRLLAADLVFQMPFVGELARKSGSTLACQPDAERLLSGGELVGVFPEGFKGVGKPFSERYKLQRFGRGGFVSAALATSTPIIPCAIVGAEEIYPKIGEAKFIARMFGLPYFPLTPTFPWLGPVGAVPLPSKWYIEIGEPIQTAGLASGTDDPMQVFNLTDQVRETIQQMLYRLLMKRKSVFS